MAKGQRGWKWQPGGGFSGLGISPCRMIRCRRASSTSQQLPDPMFTPVMPPDYYRESEEQSLETLGRSLDPSWGEPPIVRTVREAPPPVITPRAPPAPPPAPPPPKPKLASGATPRSNPGSWATNDDYPSAALRAEEEGVTGFRLTVGTDGRVSECSVTSSSGSSTLDAATCKLITRRARFTPAKDADGNPVTDTYSNRIRWQIPED